MKKPQAKNFYEKRTRKTALVLRSKAGVNNAIGANE
jgi:hypothetical protein